MAASNAVGPQSAGGGRRRSRLLVGIRFAFGFLTPFALVTGFFGLQQLVAGLGPVQARVLGTSFRDILYYDLQLFVLSSQPLEMTTDYPALLDIARFAAPAATALALVEAAHAIFSGQVHQWLDRHRRGHAIVTGDTAIARAIYAELRADGTHVTWIVDATAEALVGAGVRGAGVVYACADDAAGDSTLNVVTAQTAATTRRWARRAGRLRVYAQVTDPMLALSLRARWLGQEGMDRPDVDYFTVDVLAARACLRATDFPTAVQGSPTLTIAGWGTFAQALLVEYAQRWQVQFDAGDHPERIRVTVVGATQAEVADVSSRWDVIDEICDVTAVPEHEAPWLSHSELPFRTFICYEDETAALTTALTASRLWAGGPGSVVVRLSRLALPADPKDVSGRRALALVDTIGGCLRVVSVTEYACQPEVIGEDIVERLAQSIHRRYLVARRLDRAPMHSSPAMVWWSDASEDIRRANRHPARHIGTKLAMVDATVAPRTGAPVPFAFTPAEMDRLAEAEHARWCEERRANGWTYGTPRDDAARKHPSLVAWADLDEAERAKDHDAVRDLECVLADAGLQMVRLGSRPSRGDSTGATVRLPAQASLAT